MSGGPAHLLDGPFRTLCGKEDPPPGPYLRTAETVAEATCPDCLAGAAEHPDYRKEQP